MQALSWSPSLGSWSMCGVYCSLTSFSFVRVEMGNDRITICSQAAKQTHINIHQKLLIVNTLGDIEMKFRFSGKIFQK